MNLLFNSCKMPSQKRASLLAIGSVSIADLGFIRTILKFKNNLIDPLEEYKSKNDCANFQQIDKIKTEYKKLMEKKKNQY